ncbi:MAG: hypothetical protein M3Y59_17270 [Myxococcota bacterium]|nr:hypothetical protein [Myxococcota bacterium]
MSDKPSQLPSSFRVVTWIALVVTGLISFWGLAEAMSVFNPVPLEQPLPQTDAPLVDPQLVQAMLRAQLDAGAGMRGPRGAVLMFLSFICGLASVSALRLLYPAGLPREGMRTITGGTLLVAGILRTIDGAMQLVITQRTAAALKKELEAGRAGSLGLEGQADLLPSVMMAGSLGMTVFMVGTLIGAAQYLRSARAKEIVRAVDAATSRSTPS